MSTISELTISHNKNYMNNKSTSFELVKEEEKFILKHNSVCGIQRPENFLAEKIILSVLSEFYQQDLLSSQVHYKINNKMLAQKCNIGEKFAYQQLHSCKDELLGLIYSEQHKDKSITYFSIVESVHYNASNCTVYIMFTKKAVELLSGFTEGNFTTIPEKIIGCSCKYSAFMYELCKKNLFRGRFTVQVPELRCMFNIPKEKYKVFTFFRRRVLIPAIEDLHKLQDIHISFAEYKKGKRAVQEVTFFVQSWEYWERNGCKIESSDDFSNENTYIKRKQ